MKSLDPIQGFIHLGSPTVRDFVKELQSKLDMYPKDKINDFSARYLGEIVSKYYSYSGFYEITKKEKNLIYLRRLKEDKKGDSAPENYSLFDIVFPNLDLIKNGANHNFVSVKGNIEDFSLEGSIAHLSGNKHLFHVCSLKNIISQ